MISIQSHKLGSISQSFVIISMSNIILTALHDNHQVLMKTFFHQAMNWYWTKKNMKYPVLESKYCHHLPAQFAQKRALLHYACKFLFIFSTTVVLGRNWLQWMSRGPRDWPVLCWEGGDRDQPGEGAHPGVHPQERGAVPLHLRDSIHTKPRRGEQK